MIEAPPARLTEFTPTHGINLDSVGFLCAQKTPRPVGKDTMGVMIWSIAEIADAIQTGLQARAAQDDQAQVVRGFDALAEVSLHPLIQSALRSAEYGVHPEQRFPADRAKKKRSEGKRCDITLTPEHKPLATPDATETLFDPPNAVPLSEAFWLEIKVVAQFTEFGEPNARYSASLLQPVKRDVSKLAGDPDIRHAGLLLILFVADKQTSEHDLLAWQQRCLTGGYPIGGPAVRHVTITDRIGHGYATLALFPVHHL